MLTSVRAYNLYPVDYSAYLTTGVTKSTNEGPLDGPSWTRSEDFGTEDFIEHLNDFILDEILQIIADLSTFRKFYFDFSNIFLFICPLLRNKHAGNSNFPKFLRASDCPWSPLSHKLNVGNYLSKEQFIFSTLFLYTRLERHH